MQEIKKRGLSAAYHITPQVLEARTGEKKRDTQRRVFGTIMGRQLCE